MQRYIENHPENFTKETFPPVVLQQSHGDEITQLPSDATLLGYSDSCGIEIFSMGERVLAV